MLGACWRAGRALAPRGSEMQRWVTCKSTEAPFVLARPPQGSEVSCPQEAQPRASAHSSAHLVSVTSQPGPAGTSQGRGTSPNPRAATTRGPGASDKILSGRPQGGHVPTSQVPPGTWTWETTPHPPGSTGLSSRRAQYQPQGGPCTCVMIASRPLAPQA